MGKNDNTAKNAIKPNFYKEKIVGFFNDAKSELNKINLFSDLPNKKWEVSVNLSLYSVLLPVIMVIIALLILVTTLAWLPNLFNHSYQTTMWLMIIAGLLAFAITLYRKSEKNKLIDSTRLKMQDMLGDLTTIENKLTAKKIETSEANQLKEKFELIKAVFTAYTKENDYINIINKDLETNLYVDKSQKKITAITKLIK